MSLLLCAIVRSTIVYKASINSTGQARQTVLKCTHSNVENTHKVIVPSTFVLAAYSPEKYFFV